MSTQVTALPPLYETQKPTPGRDQERPAGAVAGGHHPFPGSFGGGARGVDTRRDSTRCGRAGEVHAVRATESARVCLPKPLELEGSFW